MGCAVERTVQTFFFSGPTLVYLLWEGHRLVPVSRSYLLCFLLIKLKLKRHSEAATLAGKRKIPLIRCISPCNLSWILVFFSEHSYGLDRLLVFWPRLRATRGNGRAKLWVCSSIIWLSLSWLFRWLLYVGLKILSTSWMWARARSLHPLLVPKSEIVSMG